MKHLGALMLVMLCEVALAGNFGHVSGDDTTVAKVPLRYFFNINSGMLFCNECKLEGSVLAAPSTTHGLEYGIFRLGAGVGFNSIGDVRLVPYYGSISMNLFSQKRRQGVILEFNYGSARSWVTTSTDQFYYLTEARAKNFVQPSFGYGLYYHKMRIALTLGWQRLDITKKYQYSEGYYAADSTYYPSSYTEISQRLNRFFVNLSLGI
jgi:hypothetical protein